MSGHFVKTGRRDAGCGASGGFTLVEMLVVVSILAIMAGLAAPSMSRLIAQQRVNSAASDLHLAMVKARAEAIKRNADVTVSPTDGNWANGWRIRDPASGGAPPLEFRGPTTSVSVVSSAEQVTFTGKGRTTAATAGSTFVFSATNANTTRCLAIDLTGRPYLKEGSSC